MVSYLRTKLSTWNNPKSSLLMGKKLGYANYSVVSMAWNKVVASGTRHSTRLCYPGASPNYTLNHVSIYTMTTTVLSLPPCKWMTSCMPLQLTKPLRPSKIISDPNGNLLTLANSDLLSVLLSNNTLLTTLCSYPRLPSFTKSSSNSLSSPVHLNAHPLHLCSQTPTCANLLLPFLPMYSLYYDNSHVPHDPGCNAIFFIISSRCPTMKELWM